MHIIMSPRAMSSSLCSVRAGGALRCPRCLTYCTRPFYDANYMKSILPTHEYVGEAASVTSYMESKSHKYSSESKSPLRASGSQPYFASCPLVRISRRKVIPASLGVTCSQPVGSPSRFMLSRPELPLPELFTTLSWHQP